MPRPAGAPAKASQTRAFRKTRRPESVPYRIAWFGVMPEAGDEKRGSAFAEKACDPHRKTDAECLSHGRRFQNHRTHARPRWNAGPDTRDNVWCRWQDHPGGSAQPVRPRKTAPATDKPGSASAPLAIKARICFGSASYSSFFLGDGVESSGAALSPANFSANEPPVPLHARRSGHLFR